MKKRNRRPGDQTRNCDDPPSDSHLITSFVCPCKVAHSSGVIRRRPLTCVFTSGQGAAEKERGSDLRGRWWKISPSTFQLRRQQAADGGPVSLCQPPAPELPATCWSCSQVLPGAPRCSQGSSTRGRGPRQTWLQDQHGHGNVGEHLAAVLVPALLPVNIRDGSSRQRLVLLCCSLPASTL